MKINKKIITRLALSLLWIFFCYKPEIKLDTSNTYTIAGVLEKQVHGRLTEHLIRVPNPHKNKTVFDHDVYKYHPFLSEYSYLGASSRAFCESAEALAVLHDKVPVKVLFAKNVGGFLQHAYLVLEVTRDGSAIECYSKEDTAKRYRQIWLSNFSIISISFMLLGLIVIWFFKPFNSLNASKEK